MRSDSRQIPTSPPPHLEKRLVHFYSFQSLSPLVRSSNASHPPGVFPLTVMFTRPLGEIPMGTFSAPVLKSFLFRARKSAHGSSSVSFRTTVHEESDAMPGSAFSFPSLHRHLQRARSLLHYRERPLRRRSPLSCPHAAQQRKCRAKQQKQNRCGLLKSHRRHKAAPLAIPRSIVHFCPCRNSHHHWRSCGHWPGGCRCRPRLRETSRGLHLPCDRRSIGRSPGEAPNEIRHRRVQSTRRIRPFAS